MFVNVLKGEISNEGKIISKTYLQKNAKSLKEKAVFVLSVKILNTNRDRANDQLGLCFVL